ncbi:MAG: AAA family ATPase [Bryobacteraceae bacterium]
MPSPKAPLPKVILLVGLPGSGKSTWAAEQGLPVLSSDAVRGLLADDERDQTIHAKVFAAIRYLLRQRVAIGRLVTCIDATHLTPRERRPYLRMTGVQVEAVWFDVPVEVCKERNRGRARVVPEAVIDAMAARMVRPARAEGFARVRVVRNAGPRL